MLAKKTVVAKPLAKITKNIEKALISGKEVKPLPVPLTKTVLSQIEQEFKKSNIYPKFQRNDCKFPLSVYVMADSNQSNIFLDAILKKTGFGGRNELKYIGLDTETDTKRSRQKNIPSTIQVAFGEGLVGIFQVYQMCYLRKQEFPRSLKSLLENKWITKVGVGISNDSKGLIDSYETDVISTLDLEMIGWHMNLPRVSLAAMSYLYTGVLLDKRKSFAFAPWDSIDLSNEKWEYAANDALFSRLIYERLFSPPLFNVTSEELKSILKKKKIK